MTISVQSLQKQLKQLRTQHESGGLDAAQYDQARAPLERQLLDLLVHAPETPAPAAAAAAAPAQPARAGVQVWALLGVVAVVVAAGGYALTGSPDAINQVSPEVAAAQPAPHDMGSQQMAALVQKLADRMQTNPDDAEGWVMLGRSYAAMGRHDEALAALSRAVKLQPGDAATLADFADALAVKNDRQLEGEPLLLIERALKSDPRHLKSLVLAGTAAFNRQDYAKAVHYWDQAVQVGPADNPMVQMAQNGTIEARERGKLPPGMQAPAPAPAAVQAAAPAPPAQAGANAGPAAAAASISGTVTLSPALLAKAAPDDAVFIFARAASGSRMPLALLRKQVKDLPLSFVLDDSLSMSPAARLSGASQVVVGARVSKSGQAMPQPGDLEALSAPLALGASGVKLLIASEVK